MQTIPGAHLTALSDDRTDALRLLEDVRRKIEDQAERCDLLKDAAREALLALQEATERLSTWCPELFGPAAPKFDEQCHCWRCDFTDPFEGQDDPG
jgi:hypothetical protein